MHLHSYVVRPDGSEDDGPGLSPGAVAGIVVGSLLVVALIAVAAVFGYKRYMASRRSEPNYLQLHAPAGVDDGL